MRVYSDEQVEHGGGAVSLGGYLRTGDFVEATSENWESEFPQKNWQSEFLAVAAIVGASVYLRQRGSAESKPVAEPHVSTGA